MTAFRLGGGWTIDWSNDTAAAVVRRLGLGEESALFMQGGIVRQTSQSTSKGFQ